tara:strand:+ start:295 stop:819 length:525 start_codon:yes stop_codon:yes gene_type:complete
MAISKIQSESINLADTFAFTGTVTGAGESNAPYFRVYRNGSSNVGSSASYTTITFETEVYDSANAFDTSTHRWTPQVAGKYFIYGCVTLYASASSLRYADTRIVSTGTGDARAGVDFSNNYAYSCKPTVCEIITLNGSDQYVSLSARGYAGGSNVDVEAGSGNTYFGGFLLSTS